MNETPPTGFLIDPDLSFVLILVMGWMLVGLGAIKLVIWLIGECKPSLYRNVKDGWLRKSLTGGGNRLIFGLLGFLTVLFGFFAIGAAYLLRSLTAAL